MAATRVLGALTYQFWAVLLYRWVRGPTWAVYGLNDRSEATHHSPVRTSRAPARATNVQSGQPNGAVLGTKASQS